MENLSEIQVISKSTFLGKEIDVYGTAENPLFKAKDVAEWIGHSNPSKMVEDAELDETDVAKLNVSTLTNSYSALFLTEDGLYEVLMQSRKPIAKALNICKATAVKIVKFAVKRAVLKKTTHYNYTFLPGINYYNPNNEYTFVTRNYGYKVGANTYEVAPCLFSV